MELLVGSVLVGLEESGRRVSDAAGVGYGLGYAAMGNVLDVLVGAGVVILAGAEVHQILDAANVAAVVSRDGGDARREIVSTICSMKFRGDSRRR
jgi:phytoene dehydrogenase-like protein